MDIASVTVLPAYFVVDKDDDDGSFCPTQPL